MTFAPAAASMPSRARCDRVPPPHAPAPAPAPAWGALDLRVLQEDNLPLDPRSWGRADVARWVAAAGGFPERFPMNGKALCLMSADMFAARVPRDGRRLHRDFRRRLAKALALQELIEKLTTN